MPEPKSAKNENSRKLSDNSQLYFQNSLLELFLLRQSVTFMRVTKNNYELDLRLCITIGCSEPRINRSIIVFQFRGMYKTLM